MDYNNIKSEFRTHFTLELDNNPSFKFLLYEIFVFGSAYVVGGYFRDFLENKNSRDLDIIVDIENEILLDIVENANVSHKINNHKGIKIQFENIQVDIWSIENNWAFKNELVKLNENDKLNSIAKGCFYNFDSLVINLHTFSLNIQNYTNYKKYNKLEILLKSPIYKNLNPTTEANILRAFYLKKKHDTQFSSDTKKYLINNIGIMKDKGFDPIEILEETMKKYLKYQKEISKKDIEIFIKELYSADQFDNQIYFEF